jgi:hypothetical protein
MPFSRWIRRRSRPTQGFRPAVVALEDRTVPAFLDGFFGPPAAGPATHLQVIVPETAKAGRSFDVIVEALDASNQPASGYTGTVTLSLGTPDAGATVPGPYQFAASDHGIHEFHVKLSQTNPETIKATDNSATPLTASAIVNAASQVATSVVVETPETAATGVATRVEVEVLDQAGQTMRNFTGTVTLSSTETTATGTPNRHTAAASLPITYTFTAHDHGEHTFLVTFNAQNVPTTGTAVTMTAKTNSPALTGTAGLTIYPPTTVTHFGLFALPFAFSGTSTPVVVRALNASDQVVSGYTGTVSFTSSDNTAKISTTKGGTASALTSFTYPFSATDAGSHTFWLTFGATGKQTLTVTDKAASLTSTTNVQVLASLPLPHRHGWDFF